ncbi:MAG: hypothetical protein H7249_04385 [Chitinophagaceae bacterium]|nr:hypothetical protein [Oligoflexus sp.]
MANQGLSGAKSGMNFGTKYIVSSAVGGALLYYAYRNRDKNNALGRIASVAGSSLLGRGLSGFSGLF